MTPTRLSIFLFMLSVCAARTSFADGAGGGGFASPIPLPPLSQVTAHQCVEKVLHQGAAANTWDVNNENLVDLGIFHIHDGIEHANLGDACTARCRGNAREAHLPLGLATCKADVDRRVFANDWRGRKAKADAMLGCAKAVINFAVCLDGTAVTLDLTAIYPNLRQEMCVNWGGPTGSHAGDQGMVQWIHYRNYCGSLTSDAAKITVTNEPGKLHVSPTAEAVGADLRNRPWCGLEGTGCGECGYLHTRCCQRVADPWWYNQNPASMDGCDKVFETLHCENGRCVPEPPPPPAAGMCAADGVDCVTCVGMQGCVWQNGECFSAEWSMCTVITDADACDQEEPGVPVSTDAGVVWTPVDAGVSSPIDAGVVWTPIDAGVVWTPIDAGSPWTPDAGYPWIVDAGSASPIDAGYPWAPDAGYPWIVDAGSPAVADAGVSWDCSLFGWSSCYSCVSFAGCVWEDELCLNVEHARFDAVSTWQGCAPAGPPDAGTPPPVFDAGTPISDAGLAVHDASTATTAVHHARW